MRRIKHSHNTKSHSWHHLKSTMNSKLKRNLLPQSILKKFMLRTRIRSLYLAHRHRVNNGIHHQSVTQASQQSSTQTHLQHPKTKTHLHRRISWVSAIYRSSRSSQADPPPKHPNQQANKSQSSAGKLSRRSKPCKPHMPCRPCSHGIRKQNSKSTQTQSI